MCFLFGADLPFTDMLLLILHSHPGEHGRDIFCQALPPEGTVCHGPLLREGRYLPEEWSVEADVHVTPTSFP